MKQQMENSQETVISTVAQNLEISDSNPLVKAIRNGKLVTVRWSQLTPDEKRAANCNLFNLYG